MATKWKPDSVGWTGERYGTGKRLTIKNPIAGVPRAELEELANQTRLDTPKNLRKRRGKAIVELAKRDKIERRRINSWQTMLKN